MTMQNRPNRPGPRQAVPGQKTTRSVPTVKPGVARPATASVPRVQPGTARAKTGRVDHAGAARGSAAQQQKKSNTPMIIGGVAGGILLIVILAVAMSGGEKEKPAPKAVKVDKTPAKPDVSQLIRNGKAKCDEGVKLIHKAYPVADKNGLQRGVDLVKEGMGLFDQANQLDGSTFDTKEYQEPLALARRKLMELRQ